MSNDPNYLTLPDVKCPICGNTNYVKWISAKEGTILLCMTGRGKDFSWEKPSCRGVACYCKKCEKYYPSTNFGFHADAYECKTCGAVQWEYTEMQGQSRRLRSFVSGAEDIISKYK